MHSVEPVTKAPIIYNGDSVRVDASARFAISLWLPAPSTSTILASNPAQEWLAMLRDDGVDTEAMDPIGGTLFIEQAPPPPAAATATAAEGKEDVKIAKTAGFGGAAKKTAAKKKTRGRK